MSITKQGDKNTNYVVVTLTIQVSTRDAKKQLDKRQLDKHQNETNEGHACN